jgi:uncharacterized protein (TIGR02147 family)
MFPKICPNMIRYFFYNEHMNSNLPSVYSYNDFRKFLSDYQKAREELDESFSRSNICKWIGLPNTRNFFHNVIAGRKVTPTYVERFVKVFELNEEEARFFRVLVKFNQAENVEEKELYLEQLISFNKTPQKVLDKKVFSFFSEWHHSVIRALLDIINFKDNYRSLSKALFPSVPPKKVKESIVLLKNLDLIRQDTHGFWRPSDKSITTPGYLRDDLILQYQIQCLDLAKQVLLKRHGLPQKISTNIISLSEENYIRVQKKIDRFKGEIRSLIHKDNAPSEYVYQLNIQLFPAAKINRNSICEDKYAEGDNGQ